MDSITKFLSKLIPKERAVLLLLIQKIVNNKLTGFKIVKLAGFLNLYRIRKGKIRLIFEKSPTQNKIIKIDYRHQVYQNL